MPRKMRRELEELICQDKMELSTAKRVRQDINLFDWLDNCSLEDVEEFPRENCWYVLGQTFTTRNSSANVRACDARVREPRV